VARGLLEQTGNDGPEPWIPIGTAVHTGRSFVGAVGEGDARDFTALGDTVNTTARLTALAGAGGSPAASLRRTRYSRIRA
jgi:adenylate cyclase